MPTLNIICNSVLFNPPLTLTCQLLQYYKNVNYHYHYYHHHSVTTAAAADAEHWAVAVAVAAATYG